MNILYLDFVKHQVYNVNMYGEAANNQDTSGDPLLKIREVVDYTRASDSTIRRAVRQGRLRAYELPGGLRFRRDAVDAWIESFAVTPQPQPNESKRTLSEVFAAEAAS